MKSVLAAALLLFSTLSIAQNSVDLEKDYQQYFEGVNLADVYISDHYTSGGITHIYFQQAIDGVPITESRGSVHFKSGGSPIVTNDLLPAVGQYSVNSSRNLDEVAAIYALAQAKGYDTTVPVTTDASSESVTYRSSSISLSGIKVKPIYYVSGKQQLSAAYEVFIEQVADAWMYNFTVDANTGEIVNTITLTLECGFDSGAEHTHSANCQHNHKVAIPAADTKALVAMDDSSYNIYPWPIESPNFGSRSIVSKPWIDNLAASPQGWHNIGGTTYTSTRGNNVDSYIDDDNSNAPTNGDNSRAVGDANMLFDFELNLNDPPEDFKDAAVTNLFYWNNVIHDVLHNYGFDEASGNFQEVNYSPNGSAGDYVRAEAQDGGGTCNANMGTPADGGNPRMQMYLCGSRDGDYDNGVIAHEYAHGLSNRLTGGPGASGCLSNTEQMGEGWSDYLGMIMTIEQGDQGTDSRGMGTWLFGEGPGGDGIRPFPYSTDFNINPMTYGTIASNSISVPHGLGSVWCTMLWDLTWAMIDEYGFDDDLYEGTGGNNMAFALVVEGLKLQPCSPGFVDGRDAIIAADELLYGGANKCLIWQSFANRGLGFSAAQGSTSSRSDGTEAFDMPPTCTVDLIKTASVSEINLGGQITYKLKTENFTLDPINDVLISDDLPQYTTFVSATDGGYVENDSVKWPLMNIGSGAKDSMYFTVEVDTDVPLAEDIIDDLESGLDNWVLSASGSTSWSTVSDQTNSGTVAFFAPDNGTTGNANIDLAMEVTISDSTVLSFFHQFDTEENYDGGVLEISVDGGDSWVDLGSQMTQGGYNDNVLGSRDGWSGNSDGWIQTIVDLSTYEGQSAIIRFQMICDFSVAGVGWWIDDITLEKLGSFIPNVANLKNDDYDINAVLGNPTKVLAGPTSFAVSTSASDVSCFGDADGSVLASPVGGSGVYTYAWSNGATTQQIANLAAGLYDVTVSDGAESIITTETVAEPAQMIADALSLSVSQPGLSDGQVWVVNSGGTSPYDILWSNGSTNSSQAQLSGGDYAVSVIDANGCESEDGATVADPSVCTNALYQLQFVFDDGAGDISFALSNDTGDDRISEEGPYTGLGTGSVVTRWFCLPADCYNLSIVDTGNDGMCNSNPVGSYTLTLLTTGEVISTGCNIAGGIDIPFCAEDNTFRVEAEIVEVSCNGTDDGAVTATALNGSGNYLYRWEDGTIGQTITDLTAGTYNLTVTDLTSNAMIAGDFEVLDSKYSMVLTNADAGAGSLRDVLTNGCSTDTVLFSADLANDVIELTSGSIVIDQHKIIKGLGSDVLAVDAMSTSRILDISTSGLVELRDITLRNGSDTPDGGNILNEGTLVMERVVLEGGNDTSAGPRSITNKGMLQVIEQLQVDE